MQSQGVGIVHPPWACIKCHSVVLNSQHNLWDHQSQTAPFRNALICSYINSKLEKITHFAAAGSGQEGGSVVDLPVAM